MRAKINFNNELKEFSTIKELKKFLNNAFYYANNVVMFNYKANIEPTNYSETNDIQGLVSECNYYDEVLNVKQVFN